jgi:hypothetical protein
MDTGWFLGWLEEMGGPAVGVTESVYMSEEARRRIQKAIKTSIPDVVVEDMVAGDARDELVREWIFCYGTGAYFRYNGVDRPTEVGIKPAAFNTMFLHLMPTHKGRTVITPDKWWSNQKDKKTVNQIVFEVDKPSGVFTDDDGVQQFNEYVPFMPKNVGANPVVANLWDSHIRLLLQDDADILIQWMAWIVQNPGVRITWSPVVIGPPGTGKTFIAKALEAAVGAHYTKVLGTDAFKDLFNNVTSGNILVVAEEIRVIGKERFTILDKLKPLITNDRIDVREHYRGRRTIKNTANFILFSNYCDALPIDSNERRWAVLPTRIESTYALEAAGMNADYFTQLHKSTTENPGAIYSWLMSIDVSRFNPKGRAPVTEGTSDMISDTTDLLYESIYDKLISGAYKDANESIFTNSVVTLLLKLDSDNFDKSRQITVEARWRNYLKSMGWTLVNRALRRNGILTKVWVNTLKVAGATKLTVEDQQALLDAHNETVGDGPNVVGMDALRAKKLGA